MSLIHISSVVFDHILIIHAVNENTHNSLVVFEIRPDPTTDLGVSCPCVSEKFLIIV